MKYVYCSVLLLLGFLVNLSANAQSPNIVLIVSDDQGYYDLGSSGNNEILTPNLDRLAEEGVTLTNFYVTSSICTPSRSGLLTGRYPQRNGTYELFRNDRVDDGHLYSPKEYATSPERILGTDLREIFISELLKKGRYTNGIFGKWDLGQLKRFLPLQQGFDSFYGHISTGMDYYTHERYGMPSMYSGNEISLKHKGTYATYLFERKAIEFLENNKNRPFFLYVPFTAPHSASNLDSEIRGSAQAPDSYLEMYPKGTDRKTELKRRYKAAVTCMDDSIGTILEFLRDNDLEKNTLVIFLSDNGGSSNANNYPLRGHKASFFEGGVRVPCLIKWPDRIAPNSSNDDMLTTLEIFPTIMAATGIKVPDSLKLDGFDMLKNLMNKQDRSMREEMFWELRGDRAARVGKWKWISSSKGNGLYDLENDTGERNDLSKERPEILEMMVEKFENWQREMAAAPNRGPFKNY